jgi:hypothetical protein
MAMEEDMDSMHEGDLDKNGWDFGKNMLPGLDLL